MRCVGSLVVVRGLSGSVSGCDVRAWQLLLRTQLLQRTQLLLGNGRNLSFLTRVEPASSALSGCFPNHWTAREVLIVEFFFLNVLTLPEYKVIYSSLLQYYRILCLSINLPLPEGVIFSDAVLLCILLHFL